MKKMMNFCQFIQAISLCLFLTFSSTAGAGERMHFSVGDFPPYFDQTMSGQGAIAVVFKAAMAAEGVDVEYDFLPWARALEYAKDGTSKGSPGWTKTPEREPDFLFSEPFVNCVDGVFFLKSKPVVFSSVADFQGLRIGVINQLTYGKEFAEAQSRNEFKTEVAPASANLLKMLLLGRVDAVILNRSVAAQEMHAIPAADVERIGSADTPFLIKPWRLAVGKRNPEAQKIINTFNAGFVKIKRNGTYQRLMSDPAYGLKSQMVR
jgi:polar amino acid transport system substrate-binding protein